MKIFKKALCVFVVFLITLFLTACGKQGETVVINYADEQSFEAALDNGENLEGKVVRFTALELHPKSAWGYNVWAGEHLNFVSAEHPDIKAGDVVVVRATSIKSHLRSWIIEYEKVNNAVIDDTTISSAADK